MMTLSWRCLGVAALLTALLAVSHSQLISVCRPGYEKAGGRCYRFSTEQMSWRNAAKFCKGDGSEIASFETISERDLLSSLVKHKAPGFKWEYQFTFWGCFWIGAHRSRGAVDYGVYKWHRNNAAPEKIRYTMPNIESSTTMPLEDCFFVNWSGIFHDYTCSSDEIGVICEEAPHDIFFRKLTTPQ